MKNALISIAAGAAALMTMGAFVSADPNASPIQLSSAHGPDRAASVSEGVVTLPGLGGATVSCVCGGVWSVGDQVIRVADTAGSGGPPIGSTGTVVCGETTFIDLPILICWDGFLAGHDGQGFCACPGEQFPPGSVCGWFVDCQDIAPAGTPVAVNCVCGGVWSVGDQVTLVGDSGGGPPIGSTGTVVCGQTMSSLSPLLICWEGFEGGHDGNGLCACPGTELPPGSVCGWFVSCDAIIPGAGTPGVIHCVCGSTWSVGDQVTLVADSGGGPPIGSSGTVVCGQTASSQSPLLICWDGFAGGHDGNGICACPAEQLPPGSVCGWYVTCSAVEAVLPCAADLNHDGQVNGFDLAILLGEWTGAAFYAPCPPHKDADLDGDCRINGFDLAILLGMWGPC